MLLKPPMLDDRVLSDIMEQLRELARVHAPEWTPPKDGDAGVMLHRIFARLMEIALERLNGVPEKNLLAFLDTLGVSLLPPSAARAPLTFLLTDGSPATLVPRGTQAGTKPAGGQEEPFVFETDDDLTVISAQLVQAFTMDPINDRYTDQTSVLSGQSSTGFKPFVGTKPISHALYLGDDALLTFAKATVEIISDSSLALLKQLTWQYTSDGILRTLELKDGELEIAEEIDQTIVRGVSDDPHTREGIQSRWLCSALATPLSDGPKAQALCLVNLKLKVSASDLSPDFVFSGNVPLDVTKDFHPFGDTPKVGDTFYIGSREAFSKPGADVTLHIAVRSSPPPTLIWEYCNNGTWMPLSQSSITDGTQSFTKTGTVSMSDVINMDNSGVFGEDAFWFRVKIADGSYRGIPCVRRFSLQTTLASSSRELDYIKLSAHEFAEEGTILMVEGGFVRVVKALGSGEFNVAPELRFEYDEGTPVELWKSSHVGHVTEPTGEGQKELIVDLSVDPSGEIAYGNILMIYNDASPHTTEFITVHSVESIPEYKFKITIVDQLRFGHESGELHRINPVDFSGFPYGERELVDFANINSNNTFFPFGKQPGVGDIFYFGSRDISYFDGQTEFPTDVDIAVEIGMISPDLKWDFLGQDGWESLNLDDGTNGLLKNGSITFSAQPMVAREVNGQNSYWIRSQIASGDYGKPVEYILVNPNLPEKGFKPKHGTGNVNPPVIASLEISYKVEGHPTVLTQNGFFYSDKTEEKEFAPFVSVNELKPDRYADKEPSFYLGFDGASPEKPVSLYVAAAPRAFSQPVAKEAVSTSETSSALPTLTWEYCDGSDWKELTVIDGTNSLTESGMIKFLTPSDIMPFAKFDLNERYWIRARLANNDPLDTQELTGVFLNTVTAAQAVTVQSETLGSSNGQPDQTFHLARTPVLSGQQIMVREQESPSGEEREEIRQEEGEDAIQERENSETGETEIWVRWHEVPSFLRSHPYSRHYMLDHSTGLFAFGDGKRGMIPPADTNNVVAISYSTGGGTAGNVPEGHIAQIRTPVPGIASVTNPIGADGGSESETVDMIKERGPQVLRHRDRAVSVDDLEWLARQAVGTRVARVKCLPNINRDLGFEPGWVTLIIVPRGNESKLSPSTELIRRVEDYLAERAFAGLSQVIPARINVVGPGYIQVIVEAKVAPVDIDEAESVKKRVISALNTFLHPLTGGPDGAGWKFGRDVYGSEVYKVIEDVRGVSHVKELKLIPRPEPEQPADDISLGDNFLVYPGIHRIAMVAE